MLFPLPGIEAQPEKIAFAMCESGEQVSFRQLDERANQVAQVLRALGIQSGDHVAMVLKNERRFLEACFGMDRAGVYYSTLNSRLTVDEIRYIVRDCGARLLLVSAELPELVSALRETFADPLAFLWWARHPMPTRPGTRVWMRPQPRPLPMVHKAWICCIHRAPLAGPKA